MATNFSTKRKLGTPWHIRHSLMVKEELLDKGRPVRVITAVRDPVARNISAYFNNLTLSTLKREFNEEELQAMMDQFLDKYSHDIPLVWFDKEMRDVLGLDVYHYPFPQKKGCNEFKSTTSMSS